MQSVLFEGEEDAFAQTVLEEWSVERALDVEIDSIIVSAQELIS